MSKNIDWSEPVSAADREWAAQFPALHGGMLQLQTEQYPVEDEETLDGGDDDEAPYSEWTAAELATEVRRRNAEDGKSLSVPSKKADLVKVLEADDEAEVTPV